MRSTRLDLGDCAQESCVAAILSCFSLLMRCCYLFVGGGMDALSLSRL